MSIKSGRLCPARGCDVDVETKWSVGSCSFCADHFGKVRGFCWKHGEELEGIRCSIETLLAQVEGLKRVLDAQVFDPSTIREHMELRSTLREQGILLVQLIKRERELTGASGEG